MSLSKQNHSSTYPRRNADFKHKFIRQTVNTTNQIDSQKFKDYEKQLFDQSNHNAGPAVIARKKHEQELLAKHS